jgi:hypothetical protein
MVGIATREIVPFYAADSMPLNLTEEPSPTTVMEQSNPYEGGLSILGVADEKMGQQLCSPNVKALARKSGIMGQSSRGFTLGSET